ADLRSSGLAEVMPRALKGDRPYTYWDYRQLAFPKNNGMRIDLVYGNEAFTAAVRYAYVDRNARKDSTTGPPSDHAPLVVDLAFGERSLLVGMRRSVQLAQGSDRLHRVLTVN